jgi:hypothetical protein
MISRPADGSTLLISSSSRSCSTSELVSKKRESELEKLAGEIGWYEEEARKTFGLALQYKLEIGRRLARAKELLPHGKFLSWAQNEFGWTPRHVQNHLVLVENAKRISHLPTGASLRMALAAIKQSQAEVAKPGGKLEVPSSIQKIHLTGEIEEGTLDRDKLIAELTRIAARLGAPKTRWKARWDATPFGTERKSIV